MPAHARLRERTMGAHAAVDAAFALFDLADRLSYGDFLLAHARALQSAEGALISAGMGALFRPRLPLIASDLAALGRDWPSALPFQAPTDEAGLFGLLYVVEGSRLGGGMLARRVGSDFPVSYLSATHRPGEWRAFRERLDACADAGDGGWINRAAEGALAAFDLYRRAARAAGPSPAA